MKQKLILFALLIFSFVGYSQPGSGTGPKEKTKEILTEIERERAKKLYFKMLDSKDVKRKKKLENELEVILGKDSGFNILLDDLGGVDSEKIKNRVEKKVEDKNKKQVTKLLSKLVVIRDKIMKDNAEVMQLLNKAGFVESLKIRSTAERMLKDNKKQ